MSQYLKRLPKLAPSCKLVSVMRSRHQRDTLVSRVIGFISEQLDRKPLTSANILNLGLATSYSTSTVKLLYNINIATLS